MQGGVRPKLGVVTTALGEPQANAELPGEEYSKQEHPASLGSAAWPGIGESSSNVQIVTLQR